MSNILKIVFSFFVLFFISFNTFSQYTEWEKSVNYNNISFKRIRFLINDSDTIVTQGVLSKDDIVNGIPCKKSVVFINGWNLKTFILADDFEINGITYPEWTKINYSQKGINIILGKDMEYQGYCCNGNYEKWYSTGIHTSLYPNENLKGFFPCKDIEIDGIPCKSSPFAGVHLHPDGKLKDCTLSKKHTIKGNSYKKNTHIEFNENGSLIRADKYVFWWLRK
jgi:hypothetical protein